MPHDGSRTILPDSVVSADWLSANLEHPQLQVIDMRGYVNAVSHGGGRQTATYTGALDEYLEGHVPGAVYIDWTKDIVDPESLVKAQIAPPELFAEVLGTSGVDARTDVVIVDHTGGHFATRLWWALRYYGHDRAAILDGGFSRWQALGLPLESGAHSVDPREFFATVRPGLWSSADDVLAATESGERQIVDARDADTYSGVVQRGSRGGHIPTAINLPAKALLDDAGNWKSPEDIRDAAENAGVDLGRPVTAYCNGGVTATAVLFGLQRAGLADISNYDGSWNDWGERSELPVEGNQDLWNRSKDPS